MVYSMINFLDLQTYTKKLKPEESINILYCPECWLTNCHYKFQRKTIFVFVNWYQLLWS